jgi:hypothetical protein
MDLSEELQPAGRNQPCDSQTADAPIARTGDDIPQPANMLRQDITAEVPLSKENYKRKSWASSPPL